jgi:hypothetical protein
MRPAFLLRGKISHILREQEKLETVTDFSYSDVNLKNVFRFTARS